MPGDSNALEQPPLPPSCPIAVQAVRDARARGAAVAVDEAPPEVSLEPEVRARPASDDEVPRGARTVINLARKAGWDCTATYARGPWLDADGVNVPYVVDSIVVRFAKGEQRAAATWIRKPTGDPDAYEFSSAHWPGELGLIKSPDFKKLLKGDTLQDS